MQPLLYKHCNLIHLTLSQGSGQNLLVVDDYNSSLDYRRCLIKAQVTHQRVCKVDCTTQ